jgi:serine O-acetyltransferase
MSMLVFTQDNSYIRSSCNSDHLIGKGRLIMTQPRATSDIPRPASSSEVVTRLDPLWARIRLDAQTAAKNEPALAGLMQSAVLDHPHFAYAVVGRLACRLAHPSVPYDVLMAMFQDLVDHDPRLTEAMVADCLAVVDRDPACTRLLEPLLYFKGYHALQTHRFAHTLWANGRHDFALYLQSRSSEVFQTDIHPAARIGQGVFLDHATGLVVGSTAVIEDDVSMLQDVTLGGTGKEGGDRHPKIRKGVLIGAGAKILGNIEIGQCARVAAGSVVLHAVPRNTTVAGVPAKVVGEAGCAEPARSMDQILADQERGEG